MAAIDEPYNINFCFPVPQRIESARVVLTPFIPALHGKTFHSQAILYPEIFDCFPFGPFTRASDFDNFVENSVRSNPGFTLFGVWDKTKQSTISQSSVSSVSSMIPKNSHSLDDGDNGALAGLIGLINSSREMLVTEIGVVMILPPFHRTHVASNAVGLLLHYALETSTPQAHYPLFSRTMTTNPGVPASQYSDIFNLVNGKPLGLRRVVWQANVRNTASTRLAERMGFKFEVVQRWGRVLPIGRPVDTEVRVDDPKAPAGGLNAAMLSLCWDDWEKGGRGEVQRAMQRIR